MRSLYRDDMVRIVVAPDRGEADRLETTLPSAVAELVRRGRSVRRLSSARSLALGGSPTPCTSLLTSDHGKRNPDRDADGSIHVVRLHDRYLSAWDPLRNDADHGATARYRDAECTVAVRHTEHAPRVWLGSAPSNTQSGPSSVS